MLGFLVLVFGSVGGSVLFVTFLACYSCDEAVVRSQSFTELLHAHLLLSVSSVYL